MATSNSLSAIRSTRENLRSQRSEVKERLSQETDYRQIRVLRAQEKALLDRIRAQNRAEERALSKERRERSIRAKRTGSEVEPRGTAQAFQGQPVTYGGFTVNQPGQQPTRTTTQAIRYTVTQDGRPIASREAASFEGERPAASFETRQSFRTNESGVVRVTESVGGTFREASTSNIQSARRTDYRGQLTQRQSIETTPLRGFEILGERLQANKETRRRGTGRSAGGGRSVAANIPPSIPASFERPANAAEQFIGASITTTTQSIESRTPLRSTARGAAIGAAGFLTGTTIGVVGAVAPRTGSALLAGTAAAGAGAIGVAAVRGQGINLLDTAAFGTGFVASSGVGAQGVVRTRRGLQAARTSFNQFQNPAATANQLPGTTNILTQPQTRTNFQLRGAEGRTVRSFSVTEQGTPLYIQSQMGRFPNPEGRGAQYTLLPFAGRARRSVSPQEALRLPEPTTRLDQTRQLTRLQAAEQERALRFYQTTPQRPGTTRQIGLTSYEFVPANARTINPIPSQADIVIPGRIRGRRAQISVTRQIPQSNVPIPRETITEPPIRLRSVTRAPTVTRTPANIFAGTTAQVLTGGILAIPRASTRNSLFTTTQPATQTNIFAGTRSALQPIQLQETSPIQTTSTVPRQTTRTGTILGGGFGGIPGLITTPPRTPSTPTTPPPIIPGFIPGLPNFGLGGGRRGRGRGRNQRFGYNPSTAALLGFAPTAGKEQELFTGIEIRGL